MRSQAWRMAFAVVLLGSLAAALVWALRSDDRPQALPTPIAVDQTIARSGTTPSAVPPSATPPVPVVTTLADIQADVEIALEAARSALAAWGEFAVTKDLGALRGTFDVEGPQFELLEAESRSPGVPLGPPVYSFVVEQVGLETATDSEIVLRADLIFGRDGETPQLFTWDIVMRKSSDMWRLWTVAEPET